MPPEDDVVATPEEPVTPELVLHDNSNPGGGGEKRQFVLPPTAPKGKPKAPPLILGKVKVTEAEVEMSSSGSGSKIPLLKSKHLETDHLGESKQDSSSFSGNRNSKNIKGDGRMAKSNVQVHRTVEKVRISKGIEMKRIVQESSGMKAKKYTSTVLHSKTASASASTKESSQRSSNGTSCRRKMTKTEASFPEVKSFTGHVRPTGSASSLTGCKSKSNEAVNNALSENKVSSQESKPAVSTSATKVSSDEVPVLAPQDADTKTPQGDFKTVDEFLKMPETDLPETKAHSPVKKTIYKSKFWEYIDPKASSKSKSSSKEHKKPYDPDEVKTFMQKKKEVRKIQQQKEVQEKEAEQAKRKKMLTELNSKCQRLALKGKQRSSEENLATANNSEDVLKKPKLEIPSQSPSMKYLKPLLDRKQGSLLRKSDSSCTRDVARQSQYLLTEFENIVKRECISFLQKIPVPPSQTNLENSTVEKVDKAVATSVSLLELNIANSDKHSQSEDGTEFESLEHDDLKHPSVPSPATVEKAVTKIQAFYRGYRVRQAMKDAQVLYHKPSHKRCSEILHQNTSKSNQTHTYRRWSFPRMPEKPYDNLSRLVPMSPIPMAGLPSNFPVPCYIPPPPSAGQAPRSPSRPRVLPSFPVTPVRVYDEPYPKQSRKSTEPLDRGVNGNGNLTPTTEQRDRDSYFHSGPAAVESPVPGIPTMRAPEPFRTPAPSNCSQYELEFVVPSTVPSILDVLREKLRLFSSENNKDAAHSNALQGTSGILNKDMSESHIQSLKEKSSDEWRSRTGLGKDSGDISTTTNEDHGADREDDVTPKVRRHKRRSRPRSQRSPVGDSTTTVDTDADYVPSATRSSASIPSQRQKKTTTHMSSSGSKSEELIRSNSLADPTTSSSFANDLAPALHLRYQAEREHLKMIEMALQVKLQSNVGAAASAESVQQAGNEKSKKTTPEEPDRLQLAIANCHKESMKAAAEMTKWMAEFQKTTHERERIQVQQTSADLAATVTAAVEQARLIGIEKRKGRRHGEHGKQHVNVAEHSHARPQMETSSESVSQSLSSDRQGKVDKSVESSLNLVQNFKESLVEKEKKRGENVALIRSLKDYQQQFPSESERGSPVPAVPTLDAPANVNEYKKGISRHSSPEDVVDLSRFEEPIDYPSIIPSGNSIDIISLDHKVSTLDYASQISSEKEGEYEETFVEDNITEQSSSLQKLSMQGSIVAELISEHSGSGIFNEEITRHSSTIVDEAASSADNSSSIVNNVSSVISKVEDVISEHSDTVEGASLRSNIEIDDEAGESEVGAFSSESKIEEVISDERSKLIDEVSQHSKIEEDIVNSNYTDFEENVSILSKISEDISKHSDDNSQQSKIEEIISQQSKIEEVISQQSNVEDNSQQSKIEEVISKLSNLEDDVSDHCKSEGKISLRSKSENKEHIHTEQVEQEQELSKNISKEDHTDEGASEMEENVSDDQFEAVEDKATETELPEDSESIISEKDVSLDEISKQEDDHDQSQSVVEDLEKSVTSVVLQESEKEQEISDTKVPVSDEIPQNTSVEDVHMTKESSIIEDLQDEESGDGEIEEPSQHPILSKEASLQVSPSPQSNNVVEESTNYEDKFEDDVTDQSKIIEENSSTVIEESKSPKTEGSSESVSVVEKENAELKSTSELQAKFTEEIPLKPPPPYTPPVREAESPSSEAKVPSLEISSQTSSEKDDSTTDKQISFIKEHISQIKENEDEPQSSPMLANSQQSSLAENISEKSQFEDDESEHSQIIDEASDGSKQEENISDSSKIIEAEKSAETLPATVLQTSQDLVTKPEFEIPLKPPPPYSPSSSLESTSLSSRSLIVSLPDDKLEKITREQVDIIWDAYKSGNGNQDIFPDMSSIMNVMYEKQLVKASLEITDNNGNGNVQPAADHSFDVLLCHLIYETMKEVLQVKSSFTSFIERVRPGPLSLQAQKLKIPKTKDTLVASVLTRVLKIIPSAFFSDFHVTERDKPKLRKWCSRPRELVDEILLEELVEEDYQWTEWWPEQVIISHHISTKIIQTLIRNALQKRKYVYSQSQ